MTKKLLLHVGLPKTSSSAMQNWFGARREKLAEIGIAYPDRFEGYKMKHAFVSQALRVVNRSSDLIQEDVKNHSEFDTILYSDEGLSNHLYDCLGQRLMHFREITENYETTVIYVTRSPEKWLKSYWQQCVVTPPNGASALWGTPLTRDEIRTHPRILALLDTQKLAADMQLSYGAANAVHFQFEDPEWRRKFINFVGAGDFYETVPSENEALPAWMIEVLRQANGMSTDMGVWRAWRKAAQQFLTSNNSILLIVRTEDAPDVVPGMINNIIPADWWDASEREMFAKFKESVLSGAA